MLNEVTMAMLRIIEEIEMIKNIKKKKRRICTKNWIMRRAFILLIH